MNKDELKQLASGTILKVKDDGLYKSGEGFKFVRLDKSEHMAIGIISGLEVWISTNRLTGGKHGQ